MRKFLIPCFGIALALVALPACSRANSAGAATAPGAGQLPPSAQSAAGAKPNKNVAIVEGKSRRSTELIAFVDVREDKAHKERALEALRAKAATLGADAIVGIEYHEGKGEPGHYSGAAVKYNKRRSSRSRSSQQTSAAMRILRDETPQPRSAKDAAPESVAPIRSR
jgi:hypothetical protein